MNTNVLTEKMIDTVYADRGRVVEDMDAARALLKVKKFKQEGEVWRDKDRNVARVYKLRDAILDPKTHEIVSYVKIGVLVSFGGDIVLPEHRKFAGV